MGPVVEVRARSATGVLVMSISPRWLVVRRSAEEGIGWSLGDSSVPKWVEAWKGGIDREAWRDFGS